MIFGVNKEYSQIFFMVMNSLFYSFKNLMFFFFSPENDNLPFSDCCSLIRIEFVSHSG